MSKNLQNHILTLNTLAQELCNMKHQTANQDPFNILILGHATPLPDGDCICSANALALLLSEYFPMASVQIKFWENTNQYIDGVRYFIDDILEDKIYMESFGCKEHGGLNGVYYKYVFVVDTDFGRTNFTGSMFEKVGRPERVFVIDHHGPRECEDDIHPTLSYDTTCVFDNGEDEKSPSTSELILILAVELKRFIDAKNASGKSYEDTICTDILVEIYKICMGSIQTDTGGFLYEGFQLSLESIAYALEWIPCDNWKRFQVKQENLTRMRYFQKDPKDSKVLSLLHGLVTAQANKVGVLIVNKDEMGDSAVKPITVLQDYDFDAMIAITLIKEKGGFKYQESNVTAIKCELRSTRPTLNCRDIAKKIDETGGGHVQAAGVTIQLLDDKVDEAVKHIVKTFQSEMKKMMEAER